MFSLIRQIAILASFCALLLPRSLPAQAKPLQSVKPQVTEATVDPSKSAEIYKQAKEELSEDWYVIYRIVDRIARANGLDNNPWRLLIVPKYNINAFATEVNLIALYNGILDQLAGDASAIACVVGHEMGHHVKRHIAMGEAEKALIIEQFQKEAEAEVMAEVEDAQSDATATSVGGSVLRTGGGFLGGIGSVLGNTGGAVLENESRQRMARAEERIQEITALKTEELEQRLAENERRQEFEADEVGYMYMARAGFEAEGCLRAMAVLGRTSGAEFDTTHPAVPKRIEKLKELMLQYPPQTLAQEGEAKISASQPLTYDRSQDGHSLRINSRRGGSAAGDIERLFGE